MNEFDDLVEQTREGANILDDIRALAQLGLVDLEHGDDGAVRVHVTALGREACADGPEP